MPFGLIQSELLNRPLGRQVHNPVEPSSLRVVKGEGKYDLTLTGGESMVQTDRLSGWCFTFAILIALPAVAPPQAAAPSQSSGGDQYTIRENVDFVVLHPTVQNRRGHPVSGLDKDDFQVYEDGVLQQIKYFRHEDVPVTVGLVVDNSGSMGPKRPEVIAAALAFARSSNPEDEMFAIAFNEHVSFGLPDRTPFTDKADHLEIALVKNRLQWHDGALRRYCCWAGTSEEGQRGTRKC